ncbi:MAG: DUF456 domain-containing protein [Gammaproteobacteria bacterium]|jgi:uncharacterized protein|nr:DUF456 domain-containing protein [Gammaproteobacteria bacterium]
MTSQLLLLIPAVFLICFGMAGLVLPVLPGAPMLFAGLVLAAWAENFAYVGNWTIAVLAILALLTYAVDLIGGALGARRYGASGRSIIGATIGAIVGIFFGIPGVLLGPFIGAVLGELTVNREIAAVSRAGWGATIGLLLGTAVKLALAFTMLGIFVVMRWT